MIPYSQKRNKHFGSFNQFKEKKGVHFKPKAKHFGAFENIKVILLTEPRFYLLNDERATKYLFVDTHTTTSPLGCTLLQKIESSQRRKDYTTLLNTR